MYYYFFSENIRHLLYNTFPFRSNSMNWIAIALLQCPMSHWLSTSVAVLVFVPIAHLSASFLRPSGRFCPVPFRSFLQPHQCCLFFASTRFFLCSYQISNFNFKVLRILQIFKYRRKFLDEKYMQVLLPVIQYLIHTE